MKRDVYRAIAARLAKRRVQLCYLDAEDLEQEGMIAAWKKPHAPVTAAWGRMVDVMRQASGSRQRQVNGKNVWVKCKWVRQELIDGIYGEYTELPYSDIHEALHALKLTASKREIELAASCLQYGADKTAEQFGVTRNRSWQAVCVVVKAIRDGLKAGAITQHRLRDLLE